MGQAGIRDAMASIASLKTLILFVASSNNNTCPVLNAKPNDVSASNGPSHSSVKQRPESSYITISCDVGRNVGASICPDDVRIEQCFMHIDNKRTTLTWSDMHSLTCESIKCGSLHWTAQQCREACNTFLRVGPT